MSRSSDAEALFTVAPVKRRGRGRHERRMDAAIVAAKDADTLAPIHDGLVAVMRALARSLDDAELSDSPYAVATVARELRAALDVAKMTPGAAPTGDPFADLMAGLSNDDAATPS